VIPFGPAFFLSAPPASGAAALAAGALELLAGAVAAAALAETFPLTFASLAFPPAFAPASPPAASRPPAVAACLVTFTSLAALVSLLIFDSFEAFASFFAGVLPRAVVVPFDADALAGLAAVFDVLEGAFFVVLLVFFFVPTVSITSCGGDAAGSRV